MARPLFPPSVLEFTCDTDFNGNEKIKTITSGIAGHFSLERWALLFHPATYTISVNVGYYVQVLGLGTSPAEVIFNGDGEETGVHCSNFGGNDGGMLNTFWRSAENFTSGGGAAWPMVWGVSQAAPLRNIVCPNGLTFYAVPYSIDEKYELTRDPNNKRKRTGVTTITDTFSAPANPPTYVACDYSSGGFAANLKVTGNLNQGSQQQFCYRNVTVTNSYQGGAWNMVYIGCNANSTAFPASGSAPVGSIQGAGTASTAAAFNQTNLTQTILDNTGNEIMYGVNTSNGQFCSQFVQVAKTPVIAEKPFISCSNSSLKIYALNVPGTSTDVSSSSPGAAVESFPFSLEDSSKVYVTWPIDYFNYPPNGKASTTNPGPYFKARDTAATMQAALDAGKHLLLTPGIYYLDTPLTIRFSNQVVLCIGMATLVAPKDGSPCVQVPSGLTGVRLAGLFLEAALLDAGKFSNSKLLHWGAGTAYGTTSVPSKSNPSGYLYDLFCRVGGANSDPRVGVETIVQIDSDWVIGDNLWLWRADHSAIKPVNMPGVSVDFYQTTLSEYPCNTALKVTGNNVLMYGLACEHTNQDNVVWTGSGGVTYFYQNELPYDAGTAFGESGYCGYKVDGRQSQVVPFKHSAYGLGVYCNFRDHSVTTPAGIVVAFKDGAAAGGDRIDIVNSFTTYLPTTSPYNGASTSSGIDNVIGILAGSAATQAGHTPPSSISGGQGGPATSPNSNPTGYHGHVVKFLYP
mmetsp:Transcript_32190/g.43960  ORF Transcript_32190/g.43960 Transcript_32190/m.43960 type:complete len:742 (-) Transcript_32190:113-2338(-)